MILYGLDQHDLAQAMSYKSRKLRDAAIVGDWLPLSSQRKQ